MFNVSRNGNAIRREDNERTHEAGPGLGLCFQLILYYNLLLHMPNEVFSNLACVAWTRKRFRGLVSNAFCPAKERSLRLGSCRFVLRKPAVLRLFLL